MHSTAPRMGASQSELRNQNEMQLCKLPVVGLEYIISFCQRKGHAPCSTGLVGANVRALISTGTSQPARSVMSGSGLDRPRGSYNYKGHRPAIDSRSAMLSTVRDVPCRDRSRIRGGDVRFLSCCDLAAVASPALFLSGLFSSFLLAGWIAIDLPPPVSAGPCIPPMAAPRNSRGSELARRRA